MGLLTRGVQGPGEARGCACRTEGELYGNGFPCGTKEKGLGSRESVQLSGGPKYQRRRRNGPQRGLHAARDTAEKGRGLVPVRRVSRSDRFE